MKSKSRLGRGLSSLMSLSEDRAAEAVAEAEVAPAVEVATPPAKHPTPPPRVGPPTAPSDPPAASEAHPPAVETLVTRASVIEIPLDSIVPNPHQPRRQLNEATLAELAASLKSTGLIQPIVVRQVGEQYQLIAGERRWRAARLAGLSVVPALVRVADSFEQAQMALIENIQRENLNAIDRALAYRSLMTQLGLTQAELAGRMGEDRSSIANHVRLLELPATVQSMVANGLLSMGHAKILAGIDDPADQERLAHLAVNQSLSVRNLERQVQESEPASPRTPPPKSAHVADLEKSIARQLGLRVQIRSSGKKGRIVVHYASLDQFDELMSRMGVKVEPD